MCLVSLCNYSHLGRYSLVHTALPRVHYLSHWQDHKDHRWSRLVTSYLEELLAGKPMVDTRDQGWCHPPWWSCWWGSLVPKVWIQPMVDRAFPKGWSHPTLGSCRWSMSMVNARLPRRSCMCHGRSWWPVSWLNMSHNLSVIYLHTSTGKPECLHLAHSQPSTYTLTAINIHTPHTCGHKHINRRSRGPSSHTQHIAAHDISQVVVVEGRFNRKAH